MKLFMYMPTPGGLTGAPKRALTLAKALRSQGVEVCIGSERNSELLTEARTAGLETIEIEPVGVLALRQGQLFGGGTLFRGRIFLALMIQNLRLFWALRRTQADAVWVRASKGIAFLGAGALLSQTPLAWDIGYEPESKGLVRKLHRFGLWAANAVVFQYHAAGEQVFGRELTQKYRGKFWTIIPGIDLKLLESIAHNRPRHGHESRPRRFTITQVGTVCDRKNQLQIVDILMRLDPATVKERLLVRFVGEVSDKAYFERLDAYIADAGLGDVVEFLGWRDDVHQLIACSDLLVMPSKDEGVPNAVQESMYLGIPVIASPVGGMAEIIDHDETGWIIPLDDTETWDETIQECIEIKKDLKDVGRKASLLASQRFGVERWSRDYARILESII